MYEVIELLSRLLSCCHALSCCHLVMFQIFMYSCCLRKSVFILSYYQCYFRVVVMLSFKSVFMLSYYQCYFHVVVMLSFESVFML